MHCIARTARHPNEAVCVLLLLTVACSDILVFALATDSWLPQGGLSPVNVTVAVTSGSNISESNDVDKANTSRGVEAVAQESPQVWNSSLTFITHESFGDGYQFCRIQGACRLGDGTVLLPSWMESHSKRIQSCGFETVRFDIETSDGAPTVKGAFGITTKDDFREIDVIGNEAPPGDRSLLAEHLTPSLIMMDILRRPSVYENITRRTYITRTGTSFENEGIIGTIASFSPMIFIDSRVSHTKDFLWPKSLLRLIRNSMEGNLKIEDLKDIYGWKVRSQALCFRSIASTNVKTQDIPETAFVPDHLFFSVNGLTRKPAEPSKESRGSTCSVKVLILNRYGQRFLEGGDVLQSLVSAYGRELSKLEGRINIESEEVFFEHSSFHEQVSVMQESDVLVAPYGEANSNIMFLRPKTKVFEILPFGFASTVYRNLSRAYGINYESVRSQPDTEVFSACIKHFNADKGQTREGFIDRWERVAKDFTQETIQSEGNVASNFSILEEDQSELKMLKECTLYQRSSVDIRDLARKVMVAATSLCNLSVDLRSLGK